MNVAKQSCSSERLCSLMIKVQRLSLILLTPVFLMSCGQESAVKRVETHEIWKFGTNIENVSETAFIVIRRTVDDSLIDVDVELKCDRVAYPCQDIERIAQGYLEILYGGMVEAFPLQQDSGAVHTSSDTLYAVIWSDDKLGGLYIISKDHGTFAFRTTTRDLVVVKSETQILNKDGSIDSTHMIPYAYLLSTQRSLQ